MLASARDRIAREVPGEARVLDVGGWAVPYSRADHVLDIAPYATRGQWGYEGTPEQDRFSEDTWVVRDICDREPWPFEDDFFDFAVCSHTLEDVRDPIWVAHELCRVAKAGYVEVPSRLWEQTYGLQGPFVGFSHHRWLIDVDAAARHIDFVLKVHGIHILEFPEHFPAGFADGLGEEQRVQQLWWKGSFSARERVILDPAEMHEYLRAPVREHGPAAAAELPAGRLSGAARAARRAARRREG